MPTLILSISGARGIVGDGLDEGIAARLAAAYAAVTEPGLVLIGRDSRHSGPSIAAGAARGLRSSGCSLTDLGIVATPTVQVAAEHGPAGGGIVITASHNPAEWNALKFIGPSGTFLPGEVMEKLLHAYRELPPVAGTGEERFAAEARTDAGARAVDMHVDLITSAVDAGRIREAGLRVVVDGVHGAGPILVRPLLESLHVDCTWIAGEPNGNLPDQPEPRSERLAPLLERVREVGADLGFALDPDGDRCALVTRKQVLGEEWTLPLAAGAALSRGRRGSLVTNLSSSSRLEEVARVHGVEVIRTAVGEANVVGGMQAGGAVFGGEGNGGVIDPRVHLGRDAGVAIAWLLDLETSPEGRGGIERAAGRFPPLAMQKHKYSLAPEARARLMDRLRQRHGDPQSEVDGLRWSWPGAWLHVRPSGTEPVVRAVAEAADATGAADLVESVAEIVRSLETA